MCTVGISGDRYVCACVYVSGLLVLVGTGVCVCCTSGDSM